MLVANGIELDDTLVDFIYSNNTNLSSKQLLNSIVLLKGYYGDEIEDSFIDIVLSGYYSDPNEVLKVLRNDIETKLLELTESIGIHIKESTPMHVICSIISSINIILSNENIEGLDGMIEPNTPAIDIILKTIPLITVLTYEDVYNSVTYVTENFAYTLSKRILERLTNSEQEMLEPPEVDLKYVKKALEELKKRYKYDTILAERLLDGGVKPGLLFREYLPRLKESRFDSMRGKIADIISLLCISRDGVKYPVGTFEAHSDLIFNDRDDVVSTVGVIRVLTRTDIFNKNMLVEKEE